MLPSLTPLPSSSNNKVKINNSSFSSTILSSTTAMVTVTAVSPALNVAFSGAST